MRIPKKMQGMPSIPVTRGIAKRFKVKKRMPRHLGGGPNNNFKSQYPSETRLKGNEGGIR